MYNSMHSTAYTCILAFTEHHYQMHLALNIDCDSKILGVIPGNRGRNTRFQIMLSSSHWTVTRLSDFNFLVASLFLLFFYWFKLIFPHSPPRFPFSFFAISFLNQDIVLNEVAFPSFQNGAWSILFLFLFLCFLCDYPWCLNF